MGVDNSLMWLSFTRTASTHDGIGGFDLEQVKAGAPPGVAKIVSAWGVAGRLIRRWRVPRQACEVAGSGVAGNGRPVA